MQQPKLKGWPAKNSISSRSIPSARFQTQSSRRSQVIPARRMLLWSVLYLTGTRAVNAQYERLGEPAVTLDDIRHFRQFGSKAPGHPEYHWVSGVETTTGPLGQGTGYESLLYDCMIGDATLFQRADNIEAGWQAVQPILNA
jgi:Transketolase, thiamine diphosphate binding domain/Glucose-6-phosphate dehydrogenase, C-terminal domain